MPLTGIKPGMFFIRSKFQAKQRQSLGQRFQYIVSGEGELRPFLGLEIQI
jgi:hypothetical protein